jgi:predicted Zn-dependent protease
MKPMFWVVMCLTLLGTICPAITLAEGETDPLWNRPRFEKKVLLIGHRLLERNNIREHIGFSITSEAGINADARDDYAKVRVYNELLKVVDNDDELAWVIGHEIAHILKRHGLKKRIPTVILGNTVGALAALSATNPFETAYLFEKGKRRVANTTNNFMNGQEQEADAIGLDLMVGAGYDPWAAYRMGEKIFGDGYLMRFFRSHPNAKTRLAALEKQILAKYPNSKRYPAVSEPLAKPDASQQKPVPFYIQD